MKIRHVLLGAACGVALLASGFALAQSMQPGMSHGAQSGVPSAMQGHMSQMKGMQGHHQAGVAEEATMPGQAAFGAIQEIVRLLDADPSTDWTKVNIGVLREHLVDMDEVTMRAVAATKPVDGGLEIAVTGAGRTFDAIRRMVPAHAEELNKLNGWSAKTSEIADGVLLTITAAASNETAHIRGLGFFGLLASGSHHQLHHVAMAKGERHIHQ